MWCRGLRFLKKLGYLPGKSCLVGLRLFIGLLRGGLHLSDLLLYTFSDGRGRSRSSLLGLPICKDCVVLFPSRVLVERSVRSVTIEEFLLHLPFKDKRLFMVCWDVCSYLRHLE